MVSPYAIVDIEEYYWAGVDNEEAERIAAAIRRGMELDGEGESNWLTFQTPSERKSRQMQQ